MIGLTGPELVAAWRALGLGSTPLELGLAEPGATLADRDRAHARALRELGGRGLAEATGRPVPALAEPLGVLGRADATLDLRLSTGLVALGGWSGDRGALVVRRGAELWVHRLDRVRVAPAVVDLVGPLRPGRSRTVNLDAEVFDAARHAVTDGRHWTLADRLVELGTSRDDAGSLARMCTGITASGQLGATAHKPDGEHRGRWVIGFHRAEAGDFLQLRRPGPGGRRWVTLAPTSRDGLLTRVHELLADLDDPHRHPVGAASTTR